MAGEASARRFANLAGQLFAFHYVRGLLGAVLLLAALLKAELLLHGFPVTGGWVLVCCEFAFSLWLLFGGYACVTWCLTLAVFTCFAVITTGQSIQGQASCGCFGALSVPPQAALLIDLTAIILLLGSYRSVVTTANVPRLLQVGTVAVAMVVLSTAWCFEPGRPRDKMAGPDLAGISMVGRYAFVDVRSWQGGIFPLLQYMDIRDELGSGEWLVILYRPGCTNCDVMIRHVLGHERTVIDGKTGIALVSVATPSALDGFESSENIRWGVLSPSYQWVVSTPLVVRLADGQVVDIPENGV